jgi:hypothetical protein
VSREVNRKGAMRKRILVNIGMEERLVNVTALSYARDAADWTETYRKAQKLVHFLVKRTPKVHNKKHTNYLT